MDVFHTAVRPAKREGCVICFHSGHLTDWSKGGSRGLKQHQDPKRLFFKGELRHTVQDLMHLGTRPAKREECGHDFLPLSEPCGLMKAVQSEVAYPQQPAVTVQRGECRPHSALSVCAWNWALVIVVAQIEPPSLLNQRKGKTEPSPTLPAGDRKICKSS